MDDLDILAKIGDMKEIDYRNTLAIASIIEVLVEKGIIERKDIMRKSRQLDNMTIDEVKLMRTKKF